MNNMEKAFNTAVAILATFFTYLFGGWDLALKILITFMVLDYMTGVIYAANEGISLLENISNLGVPIPNKIKTALEQLNNDEDQEKE